MDNSIRKRKRKGSQTSLTLGHKCKKYHKQFHNQIESNCTSGINQPALHTFSLSDALNNPIDRNHFAHVPNENSQSDHNTATIKETCTVGIQTASNETYNKFTQTEQNFVDKCEAFMQSETRSPGDLCTAVFLCLCILNV